MPQIFKHFFCLFVFFFNVYSSSFYISTRMITSKQSETAVKVCDFTSILEFFFSLWYVFAVLHCYIHVFKICMCRWRSWHVSIRLGIIFDDRKTVKKVVISSTCFINEEFNFTDLKFWNCWSLQSKNEMRILPNIRQDFLQ